MAVPRDPNFWRRFSAAVHQDEEAQAQRPELKHSYVSPLSSPSIASPTSNTYPSPSQSHPNTPGSPSSTSPITGPTSHGADYDEKSNKYSPSQSPTHPPRAHLSEKSPTTTTTTPRRTRTLTKSQKPKPPKSPKYTPFSPSDPSDPPHHPSPYSQPRTRHPNHSQLTLGLSGRPPSRFKFWTSVTANPHHRESWLEEQNRKKKKRTCMCWGFWIVLAAIIAGVVVAVLLLKSKGIL